MKESIQLELGEIKNTLTSHNNRITELEECTKELEEKLQNRNDKEVNKKARGKILEEKVKYLMKKYKRNNLQIVGIPEGEEKGKGEEQIVRERIAENFPTFWKEKPIQIQEAKRVPNKINPKRPTPTLVEKQRQR